MVVPALLGYGRYVIEGDSMRGSIGRGSLVIEQSVPVGSLRAGDVITYVPPSGALGHGRITHRIVWIGRDRSGNPLFRTKGDANATADPWRFTLPRATQPRVVLAIPMAGYAYAALSIRAVRVAAIGIPALLVAVGALASIGAAGVERRVAGGAG